MKKKNSTLVLPIFVANAILKKAQEKKIKINSVKLYNLIYLVYLDYLYHTQTKLFNENFSYSYKGPILPSVYFNFNRYGDEEIKSFATDNQGVIYTVHNDMLDSIIDLNLNLYGYSYPNELIEITKKRSNIRQKFYNGVDSSEEIKKRYQDQKVYTLHLKQLENNLDKL